MRRAAKVGHDGATMPDNGTAHGGYREPWSVRRAGPLFGGRPGVPSSSHTHPLVPEV